MPIPTGSSRFSQISITLLLTAVWAAPLVAQVGGGAGMPRVGRVRADSNHPIAPVPPDAYEPVTGSIVIHAEPADRVSAMRPLRKAAKNGLTHNPDMDPWDLTVKFNATGNLSYVGEGELTETWLSGQDWRVTMSLGSYKFVRSGWAAQIGDQTAASLVPMRAQMLRNEAIWAVHLGLGMPASLRSAAAQVNGQPATCLLLSNGSGAIMETQSRLWLEDEYCVSTANGALLLHSPVPGTYTLFGYAKNLKFHDMAVPDKLTTYVHGEQVITADMTVTDPTATEAQLRPSAEMLANGRGGIGLNGAAHTQLTMPGPGSLRATQTVIVHGQFDKTGSMLESEISAASDTSLIQAAVAAAKTMRMPGMIHGYILVRFVPPGE